MTGVQTCALPIYKTPRLFPARTGDKVLSNEIEVEIIKCKLLDLAETNQFDHPLDVAIITPYKAQKWALRDMVKRLKLEDKLLIEIDTVDAFQGKEASVVFFSFVRNNGSAQFYGDARRLNVALSRGKSHVYLVGHCQYLGRQKIQALKSLVQLKILSTFDDQKSN